MNKMVEYLDKVANSLEQKGLLREAEELDIISNTLEAMDKDAVAIDNTMIARTLRKMLQNPDPTTLKQSFHAIDTVKQYDMLKSLGDPSIEQSIAAYDLAKHLFESDPSKVNEVVGQLQLAYKAFMNAKETVEKATSYGNMPNTQQPGQGQTPQQTNRAQTPAPSGDLVFTSKNVKAPANKPPVVNPALRRRGL